MAKLMNLLPEMSVEIDGAGAPLKGKLYLDIETCKVAAPAYWGYKTRWYPFMVAVAYEYEGNLVCEVYEGNEDSIIHKLNVLAYDKEIVYSAGYRDFDKYVLCGRFTNARRALSPRPGSWAHLSEDAYRWVNVAMSDDVKSMRLPDVPSKDVPSAWDKGEYAIVELHCIRDVAEAVLSDTRIRLNRIAVSVLSDLIGNAAYADKLLCA